MHEKNTPIPHNAGGGIQSHVRVLNFISLGVSLWIGNSLISVKR